MMNASRKKGTVPFEQHVFFFLTMADGFNEEKEKRIDA
jgi:hypothetical protein